MKQYTHDYTLPSLAESLLQTADEAIRLEDYDKALKLINDARQTLQQYLSRDNMVEDGDVENGWIHYNDAARELEDARKLNAHYRETMLAMGKTSMAAVGISERNLAELEELRSREKPSVPKTEKHKQIDSRYLKQQTDGANPDNPLYNKIVVMSGTFGHIKMERNEVAAALQDLGAKVNRKVSNTIQVFIQGDRAGGTKVDEVMALRASGRDVRIITPVELKEIIDKYLSAE